MVTFYESDRVVSEYLLFHYGISHELLPYDFGPFQALEFPKRCVDLLKEYCPDTKEVEGLDLGCAVGRSTFELARYCKRVVGIDNSQKFIETALRLKEIGEVTFSKRTEGELTTSLNAEVSKEIDRSRVDFSVGDACDLPSGLGQFQVALLANLIDRLPYPRRCLENMADLMTPGGIMLITSPYTWMEEFTSKSEWLGGYKDGQITIRSLDTLKKCLQESFDFVTDLDLPFLIYEHERKFQWSVAQASVWRRN